jgi:hypothetical protein
MTQIVEPIFEDVIQTFISESDDREFWLAAFDTLLHDFKLLYLDENKSHNIFLQIGACSHWLRPHQTRLTHAGGFAYPAGYFSSGQSRRGLPEFDWFVLFYREQKESAWIISEKLFGKRKLICRVTLPTRTLRHHQAVIHVLWSPGTPEQPTKKQEMFYGFRKIEDEWKCVANSQM